MKLKNPASFRGHVELSIRGFVATTCNLAMGDHDEFQVVKKKKNARTHTHTHI